MSRSWLRPAPLVVAVVAVVVVAIGVLVLRGGDDPDELRSDQDEVVTPAEPTPSTGSARPGLPSSAPRTAASLEAGPEQPGLDDAGNSATRLPLPTATYWTDERVRQAEPAPMPADE